MLRRSRALASSALLVVTYACGADYGSTGVVDAFDAGTTSKDTGGEAGALTLDAAENGSDAEIESGADAATRCYASDAFGAPALIASLNSGMLDASPRLTTDELAVVFFTNRVNGGADWDIFSAARASIGAPFSTPTIVAGVSNSANLDLDPFISDDGLTIYFSSNRGGASVDNLYRATRTSALVAFSAPAAVSELNQANISITSARMEPSGKSLYFAMTPTNGTADLFTSAIGPVGFAAPAAITSVNTTSTEEHPALTADELTMYFTSDRAGGAGDQDVWVTTRATINDSWGAARDVTELNGVGPDQMGSVSSDGCRIYYSRSSTTGLAGINGFDIYFAQKFPH